MAGGQSPWTANFNQCALPDIPVGLLSCLQTPALLVVQQFCADAAEWLAQHPHNVVVVHCKAGKGRTGLMICSLLMYLHKNAPDLANLPAKAAQAPSDAVGSDAAVGIVDCGNCPTPACQVTRQVTTTAVTSPFTNRSLERSSSDFNSSRVHPAGSRPLARSSKSSSTSSDSKQSVAAGSLFRSRSLPSGRSSNGWHPWQHVEPLQLQRLTQPVHDILALYAERRTHDGNGVTIASQRRWDVIALWVPLLQHTYGGALHCRSAAVPTSTHSSATLSSV